MPALVGINGFKGAGKDTVFGYLAEHAPEDWNVQRVAFADKLKLMAVSALGPGLFDDEPKRSEYQLAVANKLKESGVLDVAWGDLDHEGVHLTGRQYLQFFGGEARRIFGDTFWIDQVLPNVSPIEGWAGTLAHEALEAAYPGVDLLVVTDVRYPNEALRVKALGGQVWEIVRPGLVSDGHSSEIPLDPSLVDLVIENDHGLPALSAVVNEVANLVLWS